MTLQELYEKKREEHGCEDNKYFEKRSWCAECSREAMKEFYSEYRSHQIH